MLRPFLDEPATDFEGHNLPPELELPKTEPQLFGFLAVSLEAILSILSYSISNVAFIASAYVTLPIGVSRWCIKDLSTLKRIFQPSRHLCPPIVVQSEKVK